MINRTYQNDPRLKDVRKFLRHNPVKAEEVLWNHLRRCQIGYKFRRQFSIGNFVVDFYCHSLKLGIELDGWTHESEKIRQKDQIKQNFLEVNGYCVLRIKNEEVFGDISKLLKKIKYVCDARAQLFSPL